MTIRRKTGVQFREFLVALLFIFLYSDLRLLVSFRDARIRLFVCHGFHQTLIEFGGGVVAHALLAVVHGGDFDND